MILAYPSAEFAPRVTKTIGQFARVLTGWREAEALLEAAAGLIVVHRFLSDELLEQLQLVRREYELTRVAVVCHLGARNVDMLAGARVFPERFLALEQMETELPRLVRQLVNEGVRSLLVRVLDRYCEFPESRIVVANVFLADSFYRTDPELASLVGLQAPTLRTRLMKDLGHTAHELVRWSVVIRASELWNRGTKGIELAHAVGVAETTLSRDSNALIGMPFVQTARLGAAALAMRLLQTVRMHRRRPRLVHPG